MIYAMLLIVGQCHPSQVQSHYAAVQQQIAYVQVYATWRVGEDEYQNQMIEKLTQIAEQNQQIVQAIRANSTNGPTPSDESAVTTAAKGVFESKCLQCHNPGNAKGDIDLTGPLTTQQKLLVEEVTRSGEMPPPKEGKELSDEEFAKIAAWAHEDAKAVRAALRTTKPGQGK